MSRILDLFPTNEEVVVSRVLLLVHKAVDEHFPRAEKPNRQFTKTIFSDENLEGTAQLLGTGEKPELMGTEDGTRPKTNPLEFRTVRPTHPPSNKSEFETSEPTDTGQIKPIASEVASIPPELESAKSIPLFVEKASSAPFNDLNQNDSEIAHSHFSNEDATRLEDTFGLMKEQMEPSWISRLTIAFLLAGIILLVYVLLW